jgi:hypothetical protein
MTTVATMIRLALLGSLCYYVEAAGLGKVNSVSITSGSQIIPCPGSETYTVSVSGRRTRRGSGDNGGAFNHIGEVYEDEIDDDELTSFVVFAPSDNTQQRGRITVEAQFVLKCTKQCTVKGSGEKSIEITVAVGG